MIFIIVVEVFAKFIQQKNKLKFLDSLLQNYGGRGVTWWFLGYPFFSGDEEEVVEVVESCTICYQAAIDHKLNVLAETHGVRLRFGKVRPELGKPCLIALL